MTLDLGERLRVRSMVYVAGEQIPYFWPMRSFIHHNPLHGFEHLPFAEAVARGSKLFHARVFLPRELYQRQLAQGRVDRDVLESGVQGFVAAREPIDGIDLAHWLTVLMAEIPAPTAVPRTLAGAADVQAALQGAKPPVDNDVVATLVAALRDELLGDRLVYEAVDALHGTSIGQELDEMVIKSCLDFLDEGQSVWGMPQRERGFFQAWREVARRNARLVLRGLRIEQVLGEDHDPEDVIVHALEALKIPEEHWVGCFTRELARLHGWAGFVRWRASAKHYHWAQRYPADLVDLLAVRMALGLALLRERGKRRAECTRDAVAAAIDGRTAETYLRKELHGGKVLPEMAVRVETALALGRDDRIDRVFADYTDRKRAAEAAHQAARLRALAGRAGSGDALNALPADAVGRLLGALADFEREEGMLWLRATEAQAMRGLTGGLELTRPVPRSKRPFVQALFCIDTRSERIRRHLEQVGDYQTFGIAGFFGVPVSFMALGKGSETHLCPVLLTPKNLVLEMALAEHSDEAALTALEKGMHELKESVLTPFVTVEAIGLLFGFDMVGKTVAPQHYNRWRKRLHPARPTTRLLLDKLSREQADSVVRAAQRAVIVRAVAQEIGLQLERITDDIVRALREAAMGHEDPAPGLAASMGLDEARTPAFIERLRTDYRINPAFAQRQMEQLGRIGFGLDEQVRFVSQALTAIGLTRDLSRFVLLVGHGSSSENNPYESALDCGACGGNHGLVSARVLAQMANKPAVRRRLRAAGVDIADDVRFVPAVHDTTTDELRLVDLDLLPPSHLVYLDRLRNGLVAASRLCVQERLPTLEAHKTPPGPAAAFRSAQRNSLDWSQIRPEWGLSRNAFFVIGRRDLTRDLALDGRAFLHSYDYRLDRRRRLLENILTGPLVVGQWINMEHYFSTVDNERFGSGSKVYHNVAGRFGVMTGNLSDLRTGLPAQTVLRDGQPYHEPLRLITLIEAPFEHALRAIEAVVAVKRLVLNGWIRLLVLDPESSRLSIYEDGEWHERPHGGAADRTAAEESLAT